MHDWREGGGRGGGVHDWREGGGRGSVCMIGGREGVGGRCA